MKNRRAERIFELPRRLLDKAYGAVIALTFITLAAAAGAGAALAQPCSADSQCFDYGRARTYCSGNTLVTTQSRCIGQCQTVEISRTPCPGPCVADRCIGGPLGSAPSVGSSSSGIVAGACAKICTCKGKKLTYGVGYARKASQCRTRTVDCVYGCTCDPEPRCLKRGES